MMFMVLILAIGFGGLARDNSGAAVIGRHLASSCLSILK
jgi:hypothetical protein